MTVSQMIDSIRATISQCDASEREVFEALMSESEGWEMRLQELDDDDDE